MKAKKEMFKAASRDMLNIEEEKEENEKAEKVRVFINDNNVSHSKEQ